MLEKLEDEGIKNNYYNHIPYFQQVRGPTQNQNTKALKVIITAFHMFNNLEKRLSSQRHEKCKKDSSLTTGDEKHAVWQ